MTEGANAELDLVRELLTEMGHDVANGPEAAALTAGDLELDSLSTLELIMMVEERTEVEIPAEAVTANTTLGELAALIRQ